MLNNGINYIRDFMKLNRPDKPHASNGLALL